MSASDPMTHQVTAILGGFGQVHHRRQLLRSKLRKFAPWGAVVGTPKYYEL